MKFLIVGAGAIGTYIGVSLAHGGHEVAFLTRSATAAHLQNHGLSLKRENGETWRISAPQVLTAENAIEGKGYDLAVLALKTYHTSAFLESIRPQREAFPPVLCLQNGVEAEEHLSAFFGKGRVLTGTVTTAVSRSAPGQAAVERQRGVGLADAHPLARATAAAFAEGTLAPRLYANGAAMKWSKMLTNLLGNASSAILDLPPAQIFAHPGLARLEVAQLREALAIMDALHLPVVDLPGVSVRALAWGVRRLPFPLLKILLQKAVGGGRGGKMPSFHIDLHSGRGQTEVDALNSAVVRYGQRLNIPTPANAVLTRILQRLAAGEASIETYTHNPGALLAAWEAEKRRS